MNDADETSKEAELRTDHRLFISRTHTLNCVTLCKIRQLMAFKAMTHNINFTLELYLAL